MHARSISLHSSLLLAAPCAAWTAAGAQAGQLLFCCTRLTSHSQSQTYFVPQGVDTVQFHADADVSTVFVVDNMCIAVYTRFPPSPPSPPLAPSPPPPSP